MYAEEGQTQSNPHATNMYVMNYWIQQSKSKIFILIPTCGKYMLMTKVFLGHVISLKTVQPYLDEHYETGATTSKPIGAT